MHLEYAEYLQHGAVETELAGILSQPQSSGRLGEVLGRVPFGSIDACPSSVDEVLASSISFEIVKKLRRVLGAHEEVSAEVVAERIVSHIETKFARQLFRLSVSRFGHINASPSGEFLASFFGTIVRRGVGLLFCPESFVVSVEEGKDPALADEPGEFPVKWKKLLDLPQAQTNPQVAQLLAECLTPPESRSLDMQLMLLALIADKELDIKPYLYGYHGRENVPWYIRRFLADTQTLLSTRRDQTGCPLWPQAIFDGEFPVPQGIENRFRNWVDEVLSFRQHFLFSKRSARADVLVGALIGIIRGFYVCYNAPQMRRLLRAEPDSLAAQLLLVQAWLSQELVETGFGYLGLKKTSV